MMKSRAWLKGLMITMLAAVLVALLSLPYNGQPEPPPPPEPPQQQVELTVASNCENAEIDVNGQKISGKGGRFQFKAGEKVQLSVRDFPTISSCGTLTAVHTFEGWYEEDTLKSKEQQYTFIITRNTEILAKYTSRLQQPALTVDTRDLSGVAKNLPGIKINGREVSPLPQTLSFPSGAAVKLEAALQTPSLPNEICFFQFWHISDATGGKYLRDPGTSMTLTTNTTAIAWYSCFSTLQSGINVAAWSLELGELVPGGVPITVTPPGSSKTTFFFHPLSMGSQVAFQAPCRVQTPQFAFVFHGWEAQGVNIVEQSPPGECTTAEIKVHIVSPFATLIAFYETTRLGGPLADLTVSLPNVLVGEPDKTGMCTVIGMAIVKNIGNGDAGPFATGIFVDGKSSPTFDFTLLELKAGDSKSVPFIVTVPIGKHLLEAIADWKNEVNESDEKNNKDSRTVECKE
jgi:hypothetical protein